MVLSKYLKSGFRSYVRLSRNKPSNLDSKLNLQIGQEYQTKIINFNCTTTATTTENISTQQTIIYIDIDIDNDAFLFPVYIKKSTHTHKSQVECNMNVF